MTSKNVIETFLENSIDQSPLSPEQQSLLLVSNSNQVVSLEKYQDAPNSINESVVFNDLRGFIDYVNDFKGDDSVCFAARDSVVVIFDYHKKDSPKWGKHTATYNIKNSSRWRIWENAHNVWKDQRDFADFLDTGLNEIVDPNQAEVLNIVKNFRATINHEIGFEEVSGGTNFSFKKEIRSGSTKKTDIEIPEFITVSLQPFDGLSVINDRLPKEHKIPNYKLRAKVNYRLDESRSSESEVLRFKIQILNIEMAVDETLEAIRAAMSSLTSLKTYIK